MAESSTTNPDKKSTNKNNNPFNPLTEWSKWLIGINFASATGCLVVLKGAAENSHPNQQLLLELQWAILAFCISVLCAIVLIFNAAIAYIEPREQIEKRVKICTYLGYAQVFFFIIALLFLNLWVCTKANH